MICFFSGVNKLSDHHYSPGTLYQKIILRKCLGFRPALAYNIFHDIMLNQLVTTFYAQINAKSYCTMSSYLRGSWFMRQHCIQPI